MRWQPDSPICAECGYDWNMARPDAMDLAAQIPEAIATALARIPDPSQRTGRPWSASMYVWHLVDVLRIGTERLLTLTHDPDRGIACWDENALAEARRYEQLSPAVGLIVLRSAAREWSGAAQAAPANAKVHHPQFGALGALEIIRRNAHEAHHHLMDINRGSEPLALAHDPENTRNDLGGKHWQHTCPARSTAEIRIPQPNAPDPRQNEGDMGVSHEPSRAGLTLADLPRSTLGAVPN